MSNDHGSPHQILYCRCAYAKTVPQDVKDAVLEKLCASGQAFEAVSDLCEMTAQNDPRLKAIAESDRPLKIAACFPRAVKWLFHSAEAPLSEDNVEIVNMRELTADEAMDKLLAPALQPSNDA